MNTAKKLKETEKIDTKELQCSNEAENSKSIDLSNEFQMSCEITYVAESKGHTAELLYEYSHDQDAIVQKYIVKDSREGIDKITEIIVNEETGVRIEKTDILSKHHPTTIRDLLIKETEFTVIFLMKDFQNHEDAHKLSQQLYGNLESKNWELKPKKLIKQVNDLLKRNHQQKKYPKRVEAVKLNRNFILINEYVANEYIDFRNGKIYIVVHVEIKEEEIDEKLFKHFKENIIQNHM